MNGKIIFGLVALLAIAVLLAGCNYNIGGTAQQECGYEGGTWSEGKCVYGTAGESSGIPMPESKSGNDSIPNLPI